MRILFIANLMADSGDEYYEEEFVRLKYLNDWVGLDVRFHSRVLEVSSLEESYCRLHR